MDFSLTRGNILLSVNIVDRLCNATKIGCVLFHFLINPNITGK